MQETRAQKLARKATVLPPIRRGAVAAHQRCGTHPTTAANACGAPCDGAREGPGRSGGRGARNLGRHRLRGDAVGGERRGGEVLAALRSSARGGGGRRHQRHQKRVVRQRERLPVLAVLLRAVRAVRQPVRRPEVDGFSAVEPCPAPARLMPSVRQDIRKGVTRVAAISRKPATRSRAWQLPCGLYVRRINALGRC